MNDNKLYKDFQGLISYKAKFRDLQLNKDILNVNYIEFLTREINFLTSMFELLKLNDKKSELEAVKQRAKSFHAGQKFGQLIERYKDNNDFVFSV
jgi:hypothetical protein